MEITLPQLSDAMEEGTIVRWLVDDGADVVQGQEIAEIETDKATMPFEAEGDGVLRIVAAEGATLPVGALIATIGGDGSGVAAPSTAAVDDSAVERPTVAATDERARPAASPLARRIAREHGIDLGQLVGTGTGDRIVKADVLAAIDTPAAAVSTTVVELSRTQQVIAERMVEARTTVPSFEVSTDIDMRAASELRAQLKALASDGRAAPSFNDLVVKACATALREHPRVNGSYRDGRFALHPRVNVGVAVAGEDTLVVPVVFDADAKSLAQIAGTTRELAGRVRDATIRPDELAGGTFTVSNLGMYGVTHFTAVPNPPQAAILAVGEIAERVVPHEGAAAVHPVMTVTLTCDHRILYGADAAEFLARVRELLERPLALALPA
jgi:pyruvate dehydrogenase E2 component (dihydrolipoamide acetyltransferase)